MPPPLQIPPSRARRQFAARLAQRKAMLEASAKEANETDIAADGSTGRNDSEFENSHTSEQGQTLDAQIQERLQESAKGANDGTNSGSSDEEGAPANPHKEDSKGSDINVKS
jgi:hypothetical protein